MSIASPASERAESFSLSCDGKRRAPARIRLGAVGAIFALGALLTACATGGGGSSTTGASATATTTSTATSTALPIAFHVSPADTADLCHGAFGANASSVYAFSQSVYAEPAFSLSYPSYVLPANTPQAPFKLGDNLDSAALGQVFGGDANANPSISQPGGILFTICNNGPNPIILAGVGVGLISVAPHSGPIDTWQLCDGAYQPGAGVTSGCGGGVTADEDMRAVFSSGAGAGEATGAIMIGANGSQGYGPIPLTLQPGHTILITIAVTMPSAPGTYTLALTLAGDTVPHTLYAPLTPQLFAPVAHKWSGDSCKASAMLSQIPASDTSSFYICPA